MTQFFSQNIVQIHQTPNRRSSCGPTEVYPRSMANLTSLISQDKLKINILFGLVANQVIKLRQKVFYGDPEEV